MIPACLFHHAGAIIMSTGSMLLPNKGLYLKFNELPRRRAAGYLCPLKEG